MPLSDLALDHIGLAVQDLETSTTRYQEVLGARPIHDEVVSSQGVRVRFLDYGNAPLIELLEPLNDQSPVYRFLQKRGEGIHHIAFRVEDINTEFNRLQALNLQLIQDMPVPGANNKMIFFIHPKSMGGVLVEICQAIR